MKIELKQTADYDLFVMNEINRPPHSLKELLASMVLHGFIPGCAIHVVRTKDGKLKIVQGHHRFLAAKQLGVPLWYIVDEHDLLPLVFEQFSGSSWVGKDAIGAEVQAGNSHYLQLKEFMEKHKMNLLPAANLLGGESAGSNNRVNKVKAGTFKVVDVSHANDVVRITDILRAKGADFATSTAFVCALSMAIRLPAIDLDTLAERAEKYAHVMRKRGTRVEYLEEIETLYNYNARQKLPLKFMTIALGAERRANFGGNRGLGAFKKKSA